MQYTILMLLSIIIGFGVIQIFGVEMTVAISLFAIAMAQMYAQFRRRR